MPTAALPLATEVDTAPVLGRSVASGVLPTVVDHSLPIAVETATIPAFAPVDVPGVYPGTIYPSSFYPHAPYTITAPIVAIETLPIAAEVDGAFTATPIAVKPTPVAAEIDLAIPLSSVNITPEYDDAIDDVDRVPIYTMRGDWNRTGTFDHPLSEMTDIVEDVTVTRELAGTLPAEVSIVEGYSAASMTATLAGEWGVNDTDPVDAFAPYKPTAAFYTKPVIETPIELWTGMNTTVGPQLTKRFTGSVSRVSPSAAHREVKLDALDGANRLHAPIYQSAMGMDSLLLAKYGPTQYLSRINSQWLIDRILRANGIFASPPLVGNPRVSVTMHGSTVPEIGYGGIPEEISPGGPATTKAWTNTDHPQKMLYPNPAAPAMYGVWTSPEAFTGLPGDTLQISGLFRLPTTAVDSAQTEMAIRISLGGNGAVFVGIWTGRLAFGYADADDNIYGYYISDATLPTTETWVGFSGMVTFRAGPVLDLTWDYGGTTTYATNMAIPAYPGAWDHNGRVYYNTPVPFTNIQIRQNETFLPAPDVHWVSQADLDVGVNEWYGIPDLSGEDSWDLLKEVVAAEFGGCGFNEDGRFWFRSRTHARSAAIPEVITSQRTLADLVTTTDEAAVRNYITATTASYMMDDWTDILVAKDITQFGSVSSPPGVVPVGYSYFELDIDKDIAVIPEFPVPTTFFASHDDWSKGANDVAIANTVRYSLTDIVTQTQQFFPGVGIIFYLSLIGPGRLRIVIQNQAGVTVAFATPRKQNTDGTYEDTSEPALKIPGRKLTEQPEVLTTVYDQGSLQTYSARSYDLGGKNRWRQHPASVTDIAGAVLGSIGQPVPVLDAIDVPHNPRRKLYDPVTIVDSEGLGSVTGLLTGIVTTYNQSGANDKLTVRPIAAPGLGVLDDPTLGKVGSTLVFGP